MWPGEAGDGIDAISNSAIGEAVTFGSYEQDNDMGNNPEPIEWIVLDHQEGRTLLLSKYGLDGRWYNTDRVDVTWENCSLRRWLNTDFYNTAFDDTKKDMIVQVTNENPDGDSFWESMGRTVESSIGGNDTQDAYSPGMECWWWLRSPGSERGHAAVIKDSGRVLSEFVYHGRNRIFI